MDERSAKLAQFIQVNSLWQFASRTWDRQENLDGMFTALEQLQGKRPVPRETLAQKAFHADATVLFRQLAAAFPWFAALPAAEAAEVLGSAKAELADIVIGKSRNQELNSALY